MWICPYVCMMRYGIIWWVTIIVWKRSSTTHLWHAYVTHKRKRWIDLWKIPFHFIFFSSLSISFCIFVYVFIAVSGVHAIQRNDHHYDEYKTNIYRNWCVSQFITHAKSHLIKTKNAWVWFGCRRQTVYLSVCQCAHASNACGRFGQ